MNIEDKEPVYRDLNAFEIAALLYLAYGLIPTIILVVFLILI